jgi:serine/threonine-protein kinase
VSVRDASHQLGRYELLAELGQGAMGVVYKARDPVLDRVVAIKTINLTLPKDELADYEARFYQEARAAGGLNHPNIVTIYDIGKSERLAYMAMEFLEGEELRSILSSREPLPVTLALDIAIQVADGLAYAHERQVVHRDIKPANIMIVRDGLVKITDFGIARMRTNEVKTMTGMILGSPKYMSPEQVTGKRADHRVDLFSLGVVLYEMLTGETPFVADSIHGIMYQIMQFAPPPPSTRQPGLPEVLDLIVAKALNKSPDERYQSAMEFARDLRDCKNMLEGKVTGGVASSNLGADLGAGQTAGARTPERLAPAKAPVGGNEPEEARGLSLAKSFDSYEATMRLAALTGVEQEMEVFSNTQAMRRPELQQPAPAAAPAALAPQGPAGATAPRSIDAPVVATARRRTKAPSAAGTPRPTEARNATPTYVYLWVLSGIALAAALLLYLMR